jgi:hypothetical protein
MRLTLRRRCDTAGCLASLLGHLTRPVGHGNSAVQDFRRNELCFQVRIAFARVLGTLLTCDGVCVTSVSHALVSIAALLLTNII